MCSWSVNELVERTTSRGIQLLEMVDHNNIVAASTGIKGKISLGRSIIADLSNKTKLFDFLLKSPSTDSALSLTINRVTTWNLHRLPLTIEMIQPRDHLQSPPPLTGRPLPPPDEYNNEVLDMELWYLLQKLLPRPFSLPLFPTTLNRPVETTSNFQLLKGRDDRQQEDVQCRPAHLKRAPTSTNFIYHFDCKLSTATSKIIHKK